MSKREKYLIYLAFLTLIILGFGAFFFLPELKKESFSYIKSQVIDLAVPVVIPPPPSDAHRDGQANDGQWAVLPAPDISLFKRRESDAKRLADKIKAEMLISSSSISMDHGHEQHPIVNDSLTAVPYSSS